MGGVCNALHQTAWCLPPVALIERTRRFDARATAVATDRGTGRAFRMMRDVGDLLESRTTNAETPSPRDPELPLFLHPVRLLSLCPSLTELVFDLGAGDELVARTRFCVHPSAGVERLEKVGGTKNPKIDRIIELAPDLVLMNEEENRREDADALRAAGLRVHASLPRTAEETAAMVRSIGDAIGRRDRADEIARDIEHRAARVRRAARERRPVSFAYLIWREPWMTVNADTFVDAMLTLAGGRNVFGANGERYPTITIDELLAAAPDIVLLSSEPFPFQEKHVDELSRLTGFPRKRFTLVDGELLSWHGSRTPSGIDYAESVIAGAI